jgi:diaminohydroxyphosphoribosylaminopyrimidine deaminase/5-amino-6-(5-phosphoribosylamino)uracil reductase
MFKKNIDKKKYLCGVDMTTSNNIPFLFMQRCLELATLGKGNVAPNPMVGCVVIHDNKIIGEGYHEYYGGPHAEVNAINSVKDKSLLATSTLFVNLEPCNHFGKTPPCSHLIIEYKIPNVVIGCIDSYSEVAGMGIKNLQKNGVNVTVGMLEKESKDLNKRFFTFHEKKRPYIILKWAETNDGFIDKERNEIDKGINWITQPETQLLTHKWRSEESAILVGSNTVAIDNPSLTCRAISGKNPTRIIIDRTLKTQKSAKVLDDQASTIIFNASQSNKEGNLNFVKIDFKKNVIPDILRHLYNSDIQSVIIEGGAKTLQSFITTNYWDEARVLRGTPIFKSGIKAPQLQSTIKEQFTFGKDTITIHCND